MITGINIGKDIRDEDDLTLLNEFKKGTSVSDLSLILFFCELFILKYFWDYSLLLFWISLSILLLSILFSGEGMKVKNKIISDELKRRGVK